MSDQLGKVVERLLRYSDIRRNDPRENREALRHLIVGELADELEAVRKAERERCASLCEGVATACDCSAVGVILTVGVNVATTCAKLIRGER